MEKRVVTLDEVLMRLTNASNERFEQSVSYAINLVGTEANLTGLIYSLLCKDDQHTMEFAVASSVRKHSILGDANLLSDRISGAVITE
ncbi:hypothetical protein D1818_12395 [Aquimarina sp. BL5]|uniref:hypothetical protein n=1 Tax=Aquimarina sp. BL5 TaxID=1714860 RepID=UPI000E4A1B15|nr:hypothetical protein [Aquimarina sp. BL5]AXT51596.1 hypothetical protein D1818_12395 [Aquimarina sp. BL5]RKN00825.1 hypothetical protein D7036_18385 [Aquimarina sp. BL5]